MTTSVPAGRIRAVSSAPLRADRDYILYWMIAARRTRANFSLQHAADLARTLGKPLVVLEALRCDYRWASDRLHAFVIDGMRDNARAFAGTPITYLPYLEPTHGAGTGLLAALAARACVVVTDDYPAFFLPRMIQAAGAALDVQLDAVDTNGLLPMRAGDRTFLTAYSFRAFVQRELPGHLKAWPAKLDLHDLPTNARIDTGLLARWPMASDADLADPSALVARLPIDHHVRSVARRGGAVAARAALDVFVEARLASYVDRHSHPDDEGTSELSPYLHFGHIGAHEVFEAVMTAEKWTTRRLSTPAGGKREGWWGASPNAEAYLDQLVTWRELGFNMCVTRPDDYDQFASLPDWARRTLEEHESDPRQFIYTRGEFERGDTHDRVWNAAQRQLVDEGWMHNYLRMLWGKKILEWTPAPEDALDTMIEVMNKYALDGRDPNSYSGYCWTLGRYDRPWAPVRSIFGSIRYMSSDNTVRKLRIKRYLQRYG